jgi:protocatechuate 3,4-dioxygenase beta subunit
MSIGPVRLALIGGLLAALTACGGSPGSSPQPSGPVAASLSFSVQPGAVAAGRVISPAVQVAVLDQDGALFTASPVTVTLALTGGGTLDGTLTAATTGGHATFADVAVPDAGAAVRLTATSPGLTSATSAAFAVSARVATSLAFSVQPGAVVAGQVVSPAVQVSVLDQVGDLFPTPVTVSVALTGGGTLHGTLSVAASGGSAAFADLSVHEAGSAYTLTAGSAGLTPATSQAFAVTPAAADAVASDVVAGAATAGVGTAVTLTATVRDGYGNPLPGASVTFAASGSANTLVQPAAATDASGVAAGSLASTKAEQKTVTATAGAVTLATHPTVTFTPGAASATGSTLAASPAAVPDDGTPTTLTVTVGDQYGNVLAGQTVAFDASGDASITQPASATAADGTTTATASSFTAGAQTLNARVGGTLIAQTSVTFTYPPPDAGLSTVAALVASVPADAVTPALVTVTVNDHLGRPIPGATVALAGSGPAVIGAASGPSDATGVVTFPVTSAAVGSSALTATVNPGASQVAVTQQATVDFTTPLGSSISVTAAGGVRLLAAAGNTVQLAAAVLPAAALQGVTWASSNPGIASVSGAGLVTAVSRGEVTITATATDGGNATGKLTIVSCPDNSAMFVQQPRSLETSQWATATMDPGGVMTLSARFGPSGNAFKYSNNTVDGTYGYYGTNSNGFVCLPYALSGDFKIEATLNVVSTPKASGTCGVGVGFTTGFQYTDAYAYTFMPTTAGTTTGIGRYVSSATGVSSMGIGSPAYQFTIPTAPVQVSASRSGPYLTFAFDSAGATNTANVSYFTNGSTVYGAGAVYPCLSFNNVVASVSALRILDGSNDVLFDMATGTLSAYTPGSLTVASSATVVVGQSTSVSATAVAAGGGTATVTAVAADPSVVGVAVTDGSPSSTLTLTGLKAGSTTVTVTNTGDPLTATRTRALQVLVEEFSASDGYPSLAGRLYPAAGETAAYSDGELSITFDAAPAPTTLGSIDIYSYPDGALVDRIFFQNESQTVAGVPIVVGPQLARVSGNTLYFTPHFGKLAYGGSYYVAMATNAVSGTLGTAPFAGFSNLPSVATWRFTVRPAPSLTAAVTVDGSQAQSTADFRTLGGALMYLAAHPLAGAATVTVDVAAGTYTELVNYRAATYDPNLTIRIRGPAGNNRGDTAVIQYTNGGRWNGTQAARASFYFAGANLVLENLTLRNNGVRTAVEQAEAMYFDSRAGYTMAANNCSFISRQDTINTTGRTWIYNSYIEGNTDFVWGVADVALIESCSLRVVNDGSATLFAIFVARTGATGAATIGKGFVLLDSTVSVDAGISAAFGRNAGGSGFYDQVALVGNNFTGGGAVTAGLWIPAGSSGYAPISLGDASSVGWKAQNNTGLSVETNTPLAVASGTVAVLASEYDTRAHILNRVVTVSGGVPSGFADAATTWDVSGLAAAWGAP